MIKKNAQQNLNAQQTSNRILQGTSIEGEVKSDGDFRVDGRMKGNIDISGKLVVGEKGSVHGEVKCASANISGKLDGKLTVAEQLTLEATAVVEGEVYTTRLAVSPGAELSGSCNMGAKVRKMKNENLEQKRIEQRQSEKIS